MVAPTRAPRDDLGETAEPARSWWPAPSTPCRPARDRPFVQMNCAAVPAELVESEMFGHEKGAFTGAVADRRGTLRERRRRHALPGRDRGHEPRDAGEAAAGAAGGRGDPGRELGSRSVDVRILAATSKNLLEEIEKGRFRDDLYDRLNVVPHALPPMRARRGTCRRCRSTTCGSPSGERPHAQDADPAGDRVPIAGLSRWRAGSAAHCAMAEDGAATGTRPPAGSAAWA